MRVGIIACSILKLELEKVLEEIQFEPEIIYLDAALHVSPGTMRAQIVEQVHAMARRLFSHYRRGLLVDTQVGDKAANRANAVKFCRDFGLTLEETESDCSLLRQWVLKARNLALEEAPETRRPSP